MHTVGKSEHILRVSRGATENRAHRILDGDDTKTTNSMMVDMFECGCAVTLCSTALDTIQPSFINTNIMDGRASTFPRRGGAAIQQEFWNRMSRALRRRRRNFAQRARLEENIRNGG